MLVSAGWLLVVYDGYMVVNDSQKWLMMGTDGYNGRLWLIVKDGQ